jgi:branched-chain amino acid transport system permease protein
MINDFIIFEITLFAIYVIIVLSLNLAVGFTGLVNFGHMVSFGVGAYASAILTINGIPWYLAMIVGAILAGLLGTALAAISVRLKGDYFAMASLGLIFIAIAISRNWISLTRGALGLPGIPNIINNNFYYMIFTIVFATATIIIFHKLLNSETGKIFQAIRDDETAAAILGKNTYRYKLLSIVISTFFAGIAGSLFAHFINIVDPTIFDLEFFVIILSMLIAGGLASIRGSVTGTFVILILVFSIKFVVLNPILIGPIRQMLFSAILILILIFRPKGIFGRVDV